MWGTGKTALGKNLIHSIPSFLQREDLFKKFRLFNITEDELPELIEII